MNNLNIVESKEHKSEKRNLKGITYSPKNNRVIPFTLRSSLLNPLCAADVSWHTKTGRHLNPSSPWTARTKKSLGCLAGDDSRAPPLWREPEGAAQRSEISKNSGLPT